MKMKGFLIGLLIAMPVVSMAREKVPVFEMTPRSRAVNVAIAHPSLIIRVSYPAMHEGSLCHLALQMPRSSHLSADGLNSVLVVEETFGGLVVPIEVFKDKIGVIRLEPSYVTQIQISTEDGRNLDEVLSEARVGSLQLIGLRCGSMR